MKILITGGAGFLGINLVRYLLAKGFTDIRTLDIASFDYPEKQKIDEVRGDIRNCEDVRKALNGVDIVFHAAAALPLYKKQEIYDTDVLGTRNLLEESFRNHVDRFIFVSSTAVYGVPDHHPLYENDRLQGVGDYGQAKILAENECLGFREKGMCVSIVRPKSFVGPERLGVFSLLYEWAEDGKNFPLIGKGDNRYQLLDVEDLCGALYLCATKDKSVVNDTFNIGAKEFLTIREDFQAVLDKAGHAKKIIAFPVGPAIFFLKLLEKLRLSPLYMWIYETVFNDSFVSIDKAEKSLGYCPKFSNQQALIRNYEWYLNNSGHFIGKTGISHRVPWKQGFLKFLKFFF